MEERDIRPFVQRIGQIDEIIERPVRGLAEVVATDFNGLRKKKLPQQYRFPAWVAKGMDPESAEPITHAICCATLQRLWLVRRRFPDFEDGEPWTRLRSPVESGRSGFELHEELARPFLPEDATRSLVHSDFGPLDPLTASQVFWVLLYAGERQLHSPLGFMAFFSLVRALALEYPGRSSAGVGIATSPPKAWVTAKCVGPLSTLSGICRRRAELFRTMEREVQEIGRVLQSSASRAEVEARVSLILEGLVQIAEELGEIAIARRAFQKLSGEIERHLDSKLHGEGVEAIWKEILRSLAEALLQVGEKTGDAMRSIDVLTKKKGGLLGELRGVLAKAVNSRRPPREVRLRGRRLVEAPPFSEGGLADFWAAYRASMRHAEEKVRAAQEELARASAVSTHLGSKPSVDAVSTALEILAEGNEQIADMVSQELEGAVDWCEGILTRQISHASSRNWTEFDPAELISALHVLVTQKRLSSDLSVRAAIEKSLVGHRGDGSWRSGQPFYSVRGLGLWPPTSDLVWMLSDILRRHPGIDIADDALGEYVDWLERTRKKVSWERRDPVKKSSTASPRRISICGWVSERRLGDRVDLWATSYALNALLGIRDLMEFRVWERCERRFSVFGPTKGLAEVDPVDLGVPHARRLHRRLFRMARQTDGADYKKAEYSLILHGPPGSSKTAVIQALAGEMWRHARRRESREPRLIRITPADFTRMGEQRLDSEAAVIFNALMHLRGVTVLFDEIDDLLRKREETTRIRFMDLVVPAMLNRLQDLRDVCPHQEVAFLLATNYVEKIEGALIRKGRIDAAVPVVYPDRPSRKWMVSKHAKKLEQGAKAKKGAAGSEKLYRKIFEQEEVIEQLDRWPWKSIDELLRSCREPGEGLLQLRGGSRRKGSQTEEASRCLQQMIRETARSLPPPPYTSQRWNKLEHSPELREEILAFALSNSSTVQELKTKLLQMFSGQRGCCVPVPLTLPVAFSLAPVDGRSAGVLRAG